MEISKAKYRAMWNTSLMLAFTNSAFAASPLSSSVLQLHNTMINRENKSIMIKSILTLLGLLESLVYLLFLNHWLVFLLIKSWLSMSELRKDGFHSQALPNSLTINFRCALIWTDSLWCLDNSHSSDAVSKLWRRSSYNTKEILYLNYSFFKC